MKEKPSYQSIQAQGLRDSIAEIRASYEPIIKKITDLKSLEEYLSEKDDVYTRFILDLISKQEPEKIYEEGHHIFPRCVGGPSDDWNVLPISNADHLRAHQLRYEAYNEKTDELVIRLRKNQTLDQRTVAQVRGRETQKIKKLGFFDATMQSVRGKKGGAKQTQAKREGYKKKLNPMVDRALKSAMIWRHQDTNDLITELFFAPATFELVKDLYLII